MAAPTRAPGGAAASGFLGLRAESRLRVRRGSCEVGGHLWPRRGGRGHFGSAEEIGALLVPPQHVGVTGRLSPSLPRGLVAEKPDESLFFLDTGSEQKDQELNRGKEKPLRIDLILQPDSKVPAPKDILAHQVPNGKKLKRKQRLWEKLAERDVVPRKQRLLQARLQKAHPTTAEASHGQQGAYSQGAGAEPAGGFYDIWSDASKQGTSVAGEWSLVVRAGAWEPGRLGDPLTGRLAGHDAWFPGATRSRESEEKQSSSAGGLWGLLAGWGQCHGRSDPLRSLQEARRLGEKAARCRRQELFQLRSIRLQVKRREAELLRRRRARLAKRRAEATKPRRLGRLKYEDPDLEVQLSTELAESLRTLKPEGSILRDRFKSLQKRNLIEPRERAKFKRKYRLKYVEKRTFREIT
ncbi:ribosome biogenesis protein NOP53 [Chelonoidis abingdonii]|uniref:ribosome biogenesis protein NOP53 n=1 Tax=Chelonoidis abingdonii TaxID=106734 RepID=UPI003F4974AF